MSHYLEIWFRGEEAEAFRRNFTGAEDSYYPHVTLIRPFSPKVTEEEIKQLVVGACQGKTPIAFTLEGKGAFGDVKYIPVIGQELLQFADQLERVLEPKVEFAPKLDDQKTLHLTIDVSGEIDSFPETHYYMLRLTAIRDKKIWFSYDFTTNETLTREESLDKKRWRQTVRGL